MANPLAIAGPNSKYKLPDANPAGFLAGVWHGMVGPIMFFVSLVTPNVSMYETNNNGRWYEFGFLMEISGSVGGSGASSTHNTLQ